MPGSSVPVEATADLQEIWKRLSSDPSTLLMNQDDMATIEQYRAGQMLSRSRQARGVAPKKPEPKKKSPVVKPDRRAEYVAFEPTKFSQDAPCCRSHCYAVWVGRDGEIEHFRSHVIGLPARSQRREAIFKAQSSLGNGSGTLCCTAWLKCVFGVRSYTKLYGTTHQIKQITTQRKDPVRISILAWFHSVLLTADKMPDNADYLLPAPSRKTVWQWYMMDHTDHPALYLAAAMPYFNTVWRDYFAHVKLRK